jgi:hypothetical protein
MGLFVIIMVISTILIMKLLNETFLQSEVEVCFGYIALIIAKDITN